MKFSSTIISICLLVFVIFPTSFLAQSLSKRLEGETDFSRIQSISESYYDSISRGLRTLHGDDRTYKHWKREEDYLSMHLGPGGKLINYVEKNIEANDLVIREEKSTTRNTNSNWYFNGPSGHYSTPTSYQYIGKGRVDRITFHPSNPNIILVGTPNAGVWKTINGGASWYCVNDNMPAMGVSGIQYAKSNPNVVYMLTGCGDGGGSKPTAGVFKSVDGGETWSKTGFIPFPYSSPSTTAFEIAVNDVDENKVVIATSLLLYFTNNGGVSWSNISGIGLTDGPYYDVVWKPNSSNVFYAVTSTKFFKLSDASSTWTLEENQTYLFGRKSLAVSPGNNNYVYIISGPQTAPGVFRGCWLSLNSGDSFTLMSNTPNVWGGEGGLDSLGQSGYDNCFTAHPTDPNIVVMGGLITNLSNDAGQTWTAITTYGAGSSSPNYVHPDIHDVKFNPLNGYLYNCNDGGIYVSSNLGSTWSNITNNLNTTQFYHMANYNGDKNYFIGGSQDNGIKYRNYDTTLMDHVGGGDGYQPAFNPSDPTMYYISLNDGFYRVTGSGATSEYIPIPGGLHWFAEVATHPTNSNIVYLGTNQFHISQDQGNNWASINVPAHNSIAVAPSNGARMYAVGAGGKQVHQINGITGSTFIPLHTSPGFPSGEIEVKDVSVHPTNDIQICITLGGYNNGSKVYTSSDGGLSWTNKSYNIPNIPIWCSVFAANGDLFVGSDIGVFYLPNGTSQWLPFRNNMPAVEVRDLHIFESDNLLRACTYGRGIWQTNKPDGICPTVAFAFPNPLEGFHFTETSGTILISTIVSGGYGTNIYLKAENYIEFKEGFEAKDNGTFLKAYISGCGNNLPPLNGN
jgi:photosystem II stability/assembly factor-like uncharacterized protein